MPERRPRRRTGSPDLDARIDGLLDAAGAVKDRELLAEILETAVLLAGDHADTLDLKIATATIKEMRSAFRMFAPYRQAPKATIFGSARVLPDDPYYQQARAMAAALAHMGWFVVTGAGPGIMAAATEGAGRSNSFGVSIRLPREQAPNPVIAHDAKLVSMKYFFTRKLMLVKESRAFVCLPGGFGTLDETFELVTLTQTGKGLPVPIVLLDVPRGTYWSSWKQWVESELVTRRLIDPTDLNLFTVTDDVEVARREIASFYANYDSMRWVGNELVLRVRKAPTDDELRALNMSFSQLCASGSIERTEPLSREVDDADHLELPRIKLTFAKRHYGRLRELIDALNDLVENDEGTPTPQP